MGDFVMPMGFNGITGFEKLNKTLASVFMIQNNWLIILLGSKKDHLILETGSLFTLTGYFFSIHIGEFRFLLFGIGFFSKTSQYLNLCFSGMMLIYFTLESIYFVWRGTHSSSRDFRNFFCDQRFDFKNYPWGSSFSWISANFVYSVLFRLGQSHVRCHVLAFMWENPGLLRSTNISCWINGLDKTVVVRSRV